MDYAIEYMSQKCDQIIFCPCRDCQNLRRFRNIEEVRVHLIRRGFKERYTKLIWHGDNSEEYINVGTSRDVLNSETIVHDESGGENIENFEPINDVRDDLSGENV
jgi:Transposase-associated domain